MSIPAEDVRFGLPDSNVAGLRLVSDSGELNFGLVEVGCSRSKKIGQLSRKRQALLHHARRFHQAPQSWSPRVYRMVVFYRPDHQPAMDTPGYELDVVLRYTHIPQEVLGTLDEDDRYRVRRRISGSSLRRRTFDEILGDCDADRLHALIVDGGDNPEMGELRGQLAELLAQRDLERLRPPGMSVYRNGRMQYVGVTKGNVWTEVDSVLAFHGNQPYLDLVNRLRALEHTDVRDRLS